MNSSYREPWLAHIRAGDFSAIPDPFPWERALAFSQRLGNCYKHARSLGLGKPSTLFEGQLAEVKRSGQWRGSALQLWVGLWYSYRLTMMGLDLPAPEDLPYLDGLTAQLREKLQTLEADEKAVIRRLIAKGW